MAILEEKHTLKIQRTKQRGRRKDRGKEKKKKSRGNSKWNLTFYYQAQSPEPGTHISKLCRQPKRFNEKVFPSLSVWVFFSSLMLRGVGRKSIPRGRGRGESQRKVHREASGWGFPPLTWPRVHVKSSQENQESACLRKMLSCTSGCENTIVERHLLVVKPPLPKDVGTMTSLILSPFLPNTFAKWAKFFLRLFLKEMYFTFDKLKKLIKKFYFIFCLKL